MEMYCQEYHIDNACDDIPRVSARFVLPIDPHDTEKIAKAFAEIARLFAGSISFIKDTGRRCTWCGTKQEERVPTCSQCGSAID